MCIFVAWSLMMHRGWFDILENDAGDTSQHGKAITETHGRLKAKMPRQLQP
jgi:hypothetical protein